MAEKKLFRQKSIDSISSPEQLNDYIVVTNPGVWMLILSVIMMLLGMLIWGMIGKLDTRIKVPAIVHDNVAVLYVQADDIMKITINDEVNIENSKGWVDYYGSEGVKAGSVLGDLALTEVGYDEEEIVYEAEAEINAPDGIFIAEVVVDRVSPMSFLTNNE